jgi:uroporphyrinogen decarboxylase
MRFGAPDRVPLWEVIGYWSATLERWRAEGMPAGVPEGTFFGLDRGGWEKLDVELGIVPEFPVEVIEEGDGYRVEQGSDGVWRRTITADRESTQFVRYPVETRADWERYRARLDPTSPKRHAGRGAAREREVADRTWPIAVSAGSVFGWLRNWMGLEGISLALHDDEAWVQRMMEEVTDFIVATLAPALERVPGVDYAVVWEDMCYNHGSMISPEHVRRLMVPQYRRITGLLRAHGVDVVLVDCDGNHDELIPLWLEAGINGVFPLEIAAGEDPVALRKRYGADLLLVGGIDKRALARDLRDVEAEVMARVPYLLEHGGWIPSVDHAVPPDVPLRNYQHYLALVRTLAERG